MPFVKGIDVSVYDPVVNWAKVREQGYRFVFIRSSYGVDNKQVIKDTMFDSHWAGAKAAGMIRGAYHYLKAKEDGKAQAVEVLKIVKPEATDLPIALDLEEYYNEGATNKQFMDNANAFLSHIKSQTGKTPFVYSRGSFLQSNVSQPNGKAPTWAVNFRVWVAHWTYAYGENIKPIEAAGWPGYTFWQYSGERDTLDGITDERGNLVKVDFDVFKGTLDELYALAGSTAPVSKKYTIMQGDTLENIARDQGISLQELIAANPQLAVAGTILTIPLPSGGATTTSGSATTSTGTTSTTTTTGTTTGGSTSGTAGTSTPPVTYTVKSGDSLSAIALKFGTTVKAIADANQIPDPNFIRVGQVLVIPK